MPTTISEFVRNNKITVACGRVSSNPRLVLGRLVGTTWTHWKAIIKRRRATRCTFTVYLSKVGSDNALPTAEEVLDSLAVDAVAVDMIATPEETCAELDIGADLAKKYLETCRKRSAGLKRVLGTGEYAILLHDTHRIIS